MSHMHKKLTASQITQLRSQGCYAENWDTIYVKEGFDPSTIINTIFGGTVHIGACGNPRKDCQGVMRNYGIFNAEIINCEIGDNVCISNIGAYIANCIIGDDVIIENTGKIVCTEENAFGNGVEVCTINEAGGREVPICNILSAQAAYMIAMYRHNPELTDKLKAMVAVYCDTVRSDRSRIGKGVLITGCGTIINVNVGEYAVLQGVSGLSNGTINSSEEKPTLLGTGVIAHNFICGKGARMVDAVSIDRCFVGEACKLEAGFMATDSLFFSNSELGGGEAASVFGGPYTVSHHKSSLLIAGYFLFFNAGSGSNQSNHLFKTGAVHQGIHERGCKFGSNSYMMLPAREGAFTAVLGKHTSHHDTENFPYSYLVEEEGKSYLHPGANIKSYGTERDLKKWPARDRRGNNPIDRINHGEHNPYLGSKLLKAVERCHKMAGKAGVEVHNYKRIRIKSVVLKRGLKLYTLAADAALGAVLEKGCSKEMPYSPAWIDAAGMFIPVPEMDRIVNSVLTGKIKNLPELESSLNTLFAAYDDHAYAWAKGVLEDKLGRTATADDITDAVNRGRTAAAEIKRIRAEDAQREGDTVMETGYGIDCLTPEDRNRDFRNVRKL